MSAYFVIQRKMQYILTDVEDNLLVRDLKCIIESVINVSPENQQLYYKNKILNETKTLSACGLSRYFATAHRPATIGLALKMENDEFEKLELTPYPMEPEMRFTQKTSQFLAEPKGKTYNYNDPSGEASGSGEPSGSGIPKGKLNINDKPKSKPSSNEKSKRKQRK
ncbi:elongin-B-like [Aphis gossypii]|uniref:Ubiquitin-like domain-containing protein n=1 Tax=Aphis gossypii TaxID=80765 RepID=A0A9P0J8F7_APHGO|nr:elongin-B-like [Aphis gossypii]CAH1732368.1 unnamed protein product [Aphis gossypii]